MQAAARLGRTPAQVALAWTLSVAPNVLMIPGTSSVRHLEENLAVADIELDDDTREQLNHDRAYVLFAERAVTAKNRPKIRNGCTLGAPA